MLTVSAEVRSGMEPDRSQGLCSWRSAWGDSIHLISIVPQLQARRSSQAPHMNFLTNNSQQFAEPCILHIFFIYVPYVK